MVTLTRNGEPELEYTPTIATIVRRAEGLFGDTQYVVMPDRQITFRELEGASRRLAKELLAAGVTKGTPVGIHLPTGPDWVVAFFGATRIGAVAMPFSTLYRPAELRTAMRIGDVSVLLSATALLGKDHEAFLEDAVPGLADCRPGHIRVSELPYLRSIRLVGDRTRPWADPF
jgi:acyl-CoA synthetase (AMP-forming)/AMP-acid ligase II